MRDLLPDSTSDMNHSIACAATREHSRVEKTSYVSINLIASESASVVFVEIRGFVGLAEQLSSMQVLGLLDEFNRLLDKSTSRRGGAVYYRAGHAAMLGFRRGKSGARHAIAAIAAGSAIRTRFAEMSQRWRATFNIETGVGVGIHSGQVAVVDLGLRRGRTLIGDTVNIAGRLCDRALAGEVLLSSVTAGLCDDENHGDPRLFLQHPQVAIRGRRALIDIWSAQA